MINSINHSNASTCLDILPFPTVSEDDRELVLKYITFIFDKSGSMSDDIEKVYNNGYKETLLTLQKINKQSIDIRNVVKVAFYNDKTTPVNDIHQKPEMLLDMISADEFKNCHGRTNESSVIEFIDNELSSKSPAVASLRKNGPGIDFVIITDGQSNDPIALREEARKRLESNWYYKNYARIIVIYIGDDDEHKKTAIALAGGKEENVISLSTDLAPMLSSFIIHNTIIHPDATHIGDNNSTGNINGTTTSLKDSADELIKREQQSTISVDELTENDINAMISKLMGKDVV